MFMNRGKGSDVDERRCNRDYDGCGGGGSWSLG